MGYTREELQRKLEKYSTYYVDVGILQEELTDEEMEVMEQRIENIKLLLDRYDKEEGSVIYEGRDPTLPIRIEVDGVKNSIMNLYGGVEEFVRDYGGDYFNEERVEWFIKNQDYFQQSVWDFMDDWNVCFPS